MIVLASIKPWGPPAHLTRTYAHAKQLPQHHKACGPMAPSAAWRSSWFRGVVWPNRGVSAAWHPQIQIHVNLLQTRHRKLGARATLAQYEGGPRWARLPTVGGEVTSCRRGRSALLSALVAGRVAAIAFVREALVRRL